MKTFSLLLSLGVLLSSLLQVHAQTELTPNRSSYYPGESIRVSFRNGPGNLKDWVSIAREGQPNGQYFDWQYLDGTQVGERIFTDGEIVFAAGPTEPGNYEIRLFSNDSEALVVKTPITIDETPRVIPNKDVYQPGETIRVRFKFGPNHAKDWIAIYPTGGPSSDPLLWFYVDGTQTGDAAVAEGELVFGNGLPSPGSYEVRFFSDDTFDLLDAATFTVAAAGPTVTLTPLDREVKLTWNAVSSPSPVAKYQIRSAATSAGPFELLAEVNGLEYLHTSLANGTEVCYVVRAVSATGEFGPDSSLKCVAPYVLADGTFIAYSVPPNTVGNQGFNGPLGMDFEVVNPVTLTHLGAFDDGANGFRRSITVRLYDAASQVERASLEFTAEEPGVLKGGSRFKPLSTPLTLPLGFRGTITAEGYGAEEQAGSMRDRDLGVTGTSGRDSLFFLGSGRTANTAGTYPSTLDSAPAVAYAAGTFQFDVTTPAAPGKPIVLAIPGDHSVSLSWSAITSPLPAAKYQILRGSSADNLTQIAESAEPKYTDTGLENAQEYVYAVRGISVGGAPGVSSEPSFITPDLPAEGIAYVVPPGTAGTQANFSGAGGNDFDVLRPIVISKLGVFDDLSDGLKRTLTARVYDRASKRELAKLVFSPEDAGELIGGSRFKDLVPPLFLPIGFQGVITASGYGETERDGNTFGAPATKWELYTGGSLRFVGRSRWGENPDNFPQIIDGGPVNRYAAGTFFFEPVALNPTLTIARVGNGVEIRWPSAGILESAAQPQGPWTVVEGATSGITLEPASGAQYFRLRQ